MERLIKKSDNLERNVGNVASTVKIIKNRKAHHGLLRCAIFHYQGMEIGVCYVRRLNIDLAA